MRKASWRGMNWIRQAKRLAVYLRDGLACVYCGKTVEDGVTLTLDHVIPRKHKGSNEASNLVTACRCCNSSRQERSVTAFVKATFREADKILRHIRNCRRRKLDMETARTLIKRRGSVASVLKIKRNKSESSICRRFSSRALPAGRPGG